MTAVRGALHGHDRDALHKLNTEVLVVRALVLVLAVIVLPRAAHAEAPTPSPTAPAPAVDDEDWGLAGDALTVVAAGVGAAGGLAAGVALSSQATLPGFLAGVSVPFVLPAATASLARVIQPGRSLVNVGLPAAGAAVGAGLGVAAIIAVGAVWQPEYPSDRTALAVVALSTTAVVTMATTAAAVALAHVIEGDVGTEEP